jgi:hypothetical protein
MPARLPQRIAYCLERARVYGEKARAAPDGSVDQKDFSELEARWLSLARGYRFSRRLTTGINDCVFHEKNARSFLHRAGADFGDSVATTCMVRAYTDAMKAVSLTVAKLVVDLAEYGERDPDRLCSAVLILLNANAITERRSLRDLSSARISVSQSRDAII